MCNALLFGDVTATGNWAGGLVGLNSGTILECHALGSVKGLDYAGGLVGRKRLAKVSASLWDVQACGQTTSAGGTGKITTEMQTTGTFLDAGWDFVGESTNGTENVWAICHGMDYPNLTWQSVTGDLGRNVG
jgi:hypothetical protein